MYGKDDGTFDRIMKGVLILAALGLWKVVDIGLWVYNLF